MIRRIVKQIQTVWLDVAIVLRGDSGFCREDLMAWCEWAGVDYLFGLALDTPHGLRPSPLRGGSAERNAASQGLAKNARLCRIIGAELHQAKLRCEATGEASRVFTEFAYGARTSWPRSRRVIAKAEHLPKGSNPRFVVTSIPAEQFDAQTLYEQEYCARGEMENRIKEQQLYLFADRLSTETLRANQLRVYEAGVAYLLIHALRRLGLKNTELAQAQAPTIRRKLLKIGAQVRVTTRRAWLSWSQGYPHQALFARIREALRSLAPWRPPPRPC